MKENINTKAFKSIAIILSLFAVMVFASLAESSEDSPAQESSIIVKFIKGITAFQKAEVIARNGGVEVSSIPALRLSVIEVPASEVSDALLRYKADPYVEGAELNMKRKAEALPSDFYYATEQWALTRIGWESVYSSITPSGTSRVAILDTGVSASHPDLLGKVEQGISIIDNSNDTSDPHGHGTWLAGIIAAITDNGEGIAGVAFSGVNIIPVKVLGPDGTGQDSDIIQGVIWAADKGADVILMGFSNPGFSGHLQEAIDYAWEKGAVLVASTGNEGLKAATFPAGHRGVIGVSATDYDDNLALFSNYGDAVFLAAPGVEIAATDLQSEYNDYVVISGTSTSAAIVAGVAAFMKAVEPELTNGVIVGRLARTADAAGTQEQTGNGRVNMARALEDKGLDEIKPAGAPPVGDGGPFVGPYRIAARNWTLTFAGDGSGSVAISVNTGTINAPVSCGGTGTATTSQTVTNTCSPNITTSENNAIVTFTANAGSGSTFAGWSGQNNLTSSNCSGTTNPCSAVLGPNATLTVTFNLACTAPSISVGPASQIKTVGESVTFSVTASGTAPLDYQWRKDDSNISGATSSSYTINSVVTADAGNYDVVVSNGCGSVISNAATLTVNKADQTITVTTPAPANAAYNSTFNVAAAASSGLPVSITTSGVCSGSGTDSANITMTSGTGICTVYYNQAGNDNYNAAPQVTSSTTAAKLDQIITFDALGNKTYGDAPFTVSAIASSELPVSFSSLTPTTCSVSGNTVTILQAGTCTIRALQAGNDNYNAAPDVDQSFTINKADATCTISGYTGVYDGNPHGATGSCTGIGGATLEGLDLGATFTNVPGGTANWTFTDVTGNYNNQSGSVAITIYQRPITVTADNKSKAFGDSDPVFTFTVGGSGLASGDTISSVFSGSLTRDAGENVGSYAIRQGTLTANANYNITSFVNGTLTITPASTASSVTVTPNSQQYSDKVTFTATLSPASINGQAPATSVTFYVGIQNMGSCTLAVNNGSLTCQLADVLLLEPVPFGTSPTGQMAPGNRTVTAEFSGINSNFTVDNATTILTITKEDARANYTGATFASTSCATCSTATVTLAATIQDITAVDPSSDSNAGDIRKATVTFVNRDAGNAVLCNAPVGLVSASDTKTGTATCNWTANIGSSYSTSYTVGIIVNGYYTRNNTDDNTVVAVSKPQSNFITGGGYIVNQNSAGLYPGERGRKTNFGFNVKYNKGGTNLQGSINAIIRNNGRVYQIKGNAMTSLAVNINKATFNGKANIQDITNPLNIIPIDGNATLQVTMTDNGEPGSGDTIGITVWNKAGGLWFSSNWQTTSPPKTVEQNLGASPGGGNLVVR